MSLIWLSMGGWFLDIRGRVPRKVGILLGVVPLLILLGLWWVATRGEVEDRAIGPQVLPSPDEVVRSIPVLLTQRDLINHILSSLRRVGLGYLVAVAVVLPLGILMGPDCATVADDVQAVQRPLRLCHVLENPRASPVPISLEKGGSPMHGFVQLV